MDVNTYLARQYPNPPCWSLVSDVLFNECGVEATEYQTINSSIRAIASTFRLALHKSPNGFTPIPEPEDFCIVLLGKTERLGLHHCGVYFQGSVLHALGGITLYQDMASLQDDYKLMEFWGRA
jgi:hypothetical protein